MSKLTIDDVAEIKKYLMLGEMTQQEIADVFATTRKTISKIKNNKYVVKEEIEIAPENYPVPYIEDDPKTITSVDDDTTPYRLKFVESYFIKKSKNHFEPSSKKSKRFIGALWNSNRWLFNNEWDDFISQVMMVVTEKVMTFEPLDKDFNWEYVEVAGTREHSIINDNINKAIKTAIIEYANHINNSYKVESNGEISWIKPVVDSIDAVTNNEDGDFPVIEVSNEMNIFHMKDDYFGSQFLDFFSENHEEILTTGQIKFLNTMKYFQRERDDKYIVPYSQLPEECKPYSQQAIEHNKRRIRLRTEEEYLKIKKLSLREHYYDKELMLLQSFMELVEIEDSKIHEQKDLMSKWLIEHLDNEFIEDILNDLDVESIIEIQSGDISNLTLYKIADIVQKRANFLKGAGQLEI